MNRYPSAIPATWQPPSGSVFHRTQHDILHCFFVIASGTAAQVNDLPVAAVLREGHTQLFAIITAELKAISSTSAGYFQLPLPSPYGPAYGKVQQVYVQEADYVFS
ncbi:hypothetical protein KCP69_16280 [Salmonella enterica subsp. enterica]|nr:hypothetical protein KCP69_16280 [Salmonella enterica subsp. enterica]